MIPTTVFKLILMVTAFIALVPGEKTLDVYTIDVEGGKAMLVVSPSDQSMLVDVGWEKSANREASTDLLVASAKAAGLKQIDYHVITHSHLMECPLMAHKPT